jgi:hypothetical protein
MAELGILNFPTIASVAQDQQRLLEKLKNTLVETSLYEGLEHCSAAKCGRPKCSAACRFGAYRKKRTSIPSIHWLLSEHDGPLYEVRFRRVAWSQLFGDLHPSVGTIMKRNRRALDDLFNNRLVAIGAIKVSLANGAYICEIHQIVAGADKNPLERAFVPSEKVKATSFIWTEKIENLGPVIYSVLDHGLHPWKDPRQHESANEAPDAAGSAGWSTVSSVAAPSKVTKDCWREYYAWRLGLPYNACMIRYGCDPHFNLLHKAKRERVKKVLKGHPYPSWLENYWFGYSEKWDHEHYQNRSTEKTNAGSEYFDIENEE